MVVVAACAKTAPRVSSGKVVSATAAPHVGPYVNQARAAQGLSQLAPSPALTGAAVAQAQHAASVGQLTHRSAGGGNVKKRVEARGFRACLAAENLAARQPDAAAVTAAWLSSPGHRSNIMLPQATHYGAGTAVTENGTRYWALVLARGC